MNYETMFSVAGGVAMLGWVMLLAAPLLPTWTVRIAGEGIPAILSIGYLVIILTDRAGSGGFGSFAEVIELFSHPQALMAGWVHFLAFDLFVGGWMVRQWQAGAVQFWTVLICLPVTLLFGPVGYLLFQLTRQVATRLRRA